MGSSPINRTMARVLTAVKKLSGHSLFFCSNIGSVVGCVAHEHAFSGVDGDGRDGNGSEVRFEGLSVFGLIHHLHHRGHGEIEVRNLSLIHIS